MTIKKSIFFDASPLIDRHVSGVGKVLQETLHVLDAAEYAEKYNIFIFVPINEYKKAKLLGYKYIKVKWLPYPHKLFSLFSRLRIGPPIDVLLGKGIYIFENFRNWNVLFSHSITYIHDVTFKIFPEFVQVQNLLYLQKYIPLWLGRTDKIVTVSETSRQEIESQLGVSNVTVIPNAVDTKLFFPRSRSEIDAIRSRWNLPGQYYVFIGNIEPRKNLANAIKAFSTYVKSEKSSDGLVIIGGGGWKNEEIMAEIEQARASGVTIIRPEGYVPDEDLPAIISGAKALLQPSWHEGFGLPVLQALACGTPAVAADIPSLREAARGNEERVVYASPDDVSDIASAIKKVGNMPHTEQPKNIQRWSDSVGKLLELVDSF